MGGEESENRGFGVTFGKNLFRDRLLTENALKLEIP